MTGLRKAEKMSMTMLVNGRPRTSTSDENIGAVMIIESQLESLLMMLAYGSAHAKQIFRMF